MSREVGLFSQLPPWDTWPPPTGQSVMFLGSASLTSNTGDTTFIAGVALTSGLWIRNSCPEPREIFRDSRLAPTRTCHGHVTFRSSLGFVRIEWARERSGQRLFPAGRKAIEDSYSFGDFNGLFHKYCACLYYCSTARTRRFSPSALRNG